MFLIKNMLLETEQARHTITVVLGELLGDPLMPLGVRWGDRQESR